MLRCLGLSGGAAALFALSFAPTAIWPLAPAAVAVLSYMAITARSARTAAWTTLVTWMAAWLYLDVYLTQMTKPGYVLVAFYCALYVAAFAWLLRRVRDDPRLGRLPLALVVAVLWTGLEFLRGEIAFHGYPWYLVAHPLIACLPFVQSADLLGTYLVSMLAAAGAGAAIDAWTRRGRRRWLTPAIVLGLYAVNLLYGASRLAGTPEGGADGDGDLSVLVLQTNIPQSNKMVWGPEAQAEAAVGFLAETEAALDATTDLVVWPETMLPGHGLEPETIDVLRSLQGTQWHYAWGDAVVRLSAETGVPFLVGSLVWADTTAEEVDGGRFRIAPGRIYNSAYLIQPGWPNQRYDKVHLTPFGEVMPYISAWPWLEQRLLAIGAEGMSFDLDASPEVRVMTLDRPEGPVSIATPICFECTMAGVCRDMVWAGGRKRVDVLVNLSNDGWFGWSNAGRAKYNHMARFRCIENRVPMVRAANTGFSVAVDSGGNVFARIGSGRYGVANRGGVLPVKVVRDDRSTLYGRVGDLAGWLAVALVAAVVIRIGVAGRRGTRPQPDGPE